MEVLHRCCCGLDVHKETVVGCVLKAEGEGRKRKEIRRFGTMTRDLLELGDWLRVRGVTHVAMESHRGVLEAGLEPSGRWVRVGPGERPAHQARAGA